MSREYLFVRAANEASRDVEFADVADLQVLVEGVRLPAEKSLLVVYAGVQGATTAQLELLAGLPDQEFATIDELAECLLSVQPKRQLEVPQEPHEESGAPPGGAEYTNPSPVSGSVRD